jgi:hypothetical protein
VTLNVPTDTVLALTVASGGTLNLNGNDVHVRGRFTAQTGSIYDANTGTLFMDGGSQAYSHSGNILHGNLVFGGTGTKTLDYQIADNLAVHDSLHIETGVTLAFKQSANLSLISNADFVNEGVISISNKWSLLLNGTSHLIEGGDFDDVTIQTATTLNITSDFNYEGDFNTGALGSTINIGSNEINLGDMWSIPLGESFNYDVGGRLRAEKSVIFSMEADAPLTIIDANSGTFSANGDLVFGSGQLLSIESGTVNLNSASFYGSGGISVTGGSLNVINNSLSFGTGGAFVNDGGSVSITGSSTISGVSPSELYTFVNNSGSLILNGIDISEGLGLNLLGGTVSMTNVSFTNGMGSSYIFFDAGFDGATYEGIFFETGPTFNVSINDGIAETITFDQYGGAFGGPDFDNPGTTGTINWTNPQGLGSITVLTPNGSEKLSVGELFDVTWSTSNVPGTDLIEIYLSTDGGETFIFLNDGTFDTYNGTFSWTIPDEVGTDNLIQIVNTTQDISDISDGVFEIFQPGGVPVANDATNVSATTFTANWSNVGADKYFLDVSVESDFASFVSGYENVEVGTTSLEVTGLNFKQSYNYRVRADEGGSTSDNSNTISVKTLVDVETIADSTALIQIYNALGGGSWSPAVNWETARLRDWNNVGLNSTRIRVEDVDISAVGASGNMPNPFTGDALGGLSAMLELNVANNKITGLMDFAETGITNLNVSGNSLQFDDLEPLIGITTLNYDNQSSVQFIESLGEAIKVRYTNNYNLSIAVAGSDNTYQWFRNGAAISTSADFTDNGDNLDIISIDYDNMGTFRAEVTSTLVPNLTINLDPQIVWAIADFEVRVLGSNDQPIPENVFGALLETTRRARGFDTLERAPNVASTFIFPDVVLGNYLIAVNSDPSKYIPTYSGDVFLWDDADTIEFRNDDGRDLRIQALPGKTEGEGEVTGTIDTDFADDDGRIDARRRAAKRKCGLRRKTGGTRTDADDDGFDLIAYGETNDNGEFEFGFLPTGTYRFFVEYPGIPLDESSFVQFDVGEAGISENEFKLAATISETGIFVELIEELGVINKYFKDLLIYPNPSNDLLNISYRHLTTDAVSVQLLDVSGAVLYEADLSKGYDRDLHLDVGDYKEGMYILRFYDKASREKNMMSYRIIVKH